MTENVIYIDTKQQLTVSKLIDYYLSNEGQFDIEGVSDTFYLTLDSHQNYRFKTQLVVKPSDENREIGHYKRPVECQLFFVNKDKLLFNNEVIIASELYDYIVTNFEEDISICLTSPNEDENYQAVLTKLMEDFSKQNKYERIFSYQVIFYEQDN